jgi:nucleotide-binding universal stress UspA family protein
MKILLAVDGSEHSARVARHVVKMAQGCAAYEILLLNVQAPIDAPEVLGHMPAREVEAMQETRGGDAMGSARSILDAAGVRYVPRSGTRQCTRNHLPSRRSAKADAIVIGTQGAGALRSALMGSVTTEVMRLAGCPVTVVK